MDKGTQGRIDLAGSMMETSRHLVDAVGSRVGDFEDAYKFRRHIERMVESGFVNINLGRDSEGDLLSKLINGPNSETVSNSLRLLWLERVERALADLRQEAHDLWLTLDCAAMGIDKPTVTYDPATGAIVDTALMGGTASERMKQPEAETVAAEPQAKTMGEILGESIFDYVRTDRLIKRAKALGLDYNPSSRGVNVSLNDWFERMGARLHDVFLNGHIDGDEYRAHMGVLAVAFAEARLREKAAS